MAHANYGTSTAKARRSAETMTDVIGPRCRYKLYNKAIKEEWFIGGLKHAFFSALLVLRDESPLLDINHHLQYENVAFVRRYLISRRWRLWIYRVVVCFGDFVCGLKRFRICEWFVCGTYIKFFVEDLYTHYDNNFFFQLDEVFCALWSAILRGRQYWIFFYERVETKFITLNYFLFRRKSLRSARGKCPTQKSTRRQISKLSRSNSRDVVLGDFFFFFFSTSCFVFFSVCLQREGGTFFRLLPRKRVMTGWKIINISPTSSSSLGFALFRFHFRIAL